MGISFAIRSVSPGLNPSVLPTSRTTARDFMVPKVDDLTHGVFPVLPPDVVDHLAPAFEAEVNVDVGHRDTLRIQESFEEQVVLERTEVGDT